MAHEASTVVVVFFHSYYCQHLVLLSPAKGHAVSLPSLGVVGIFGSALGTFGSAITFLLCTSTVEFILRLPCAADRTLKLSYSPNNSCESIVVPLVSVSVRILRSCPSYLHCSAPCFSICQWLTNCLAFIQYAVGW